MGKFIDITGQKFGRLTVTSFYEKRGRRMYWNCICECGNTCIVIKDGLKGGNTKSCGCLHKEQTSKASKTHGMIKTSEYKTWCHIKERCLNPKIKNYHNYGGRGIKICDRWLESFENFYEDMGLKPSKEYSIDRINNDGNYEPENCRWATSKEQSNNTRQNVKVVNKETSQIYNTIKEVAEMLGMKNGTLHAQLTGKNKNKTNFEIIK